MKTGTLSSIASVGYGQADMYIGMADRATSGNEVDDYLDRAVFHWERAEEGYRQLPVDRQTIGNLHIERGRVVRRLGLWGLCVG